MIAQPLSTFLFTVLGSGAAQVAATWLGLPSIVLLLLFGVLLGPDFLGWIEPWRISNLGHYVELLVAVILFSGSTGLRLSEFRAHGRMVLHLLTTGLLVSFVLGSAAARAAAGVPWSVAALFGALMVVTGPTVVIPLLERVPLRENLRSILRWEGILVDPLGVILTIVVLELILAEGPSVLDTVGLFAVRLAVGVALGLAAGFLVAAAFRKRFFLGSQVRELGPLAGIAIALLFYGLADAIHEQSGLLCVTTAGIVLGNSRFPYKERITAFKEQIALLALSIIFILLAASVRLETLRAVAGPGLVLAAAMMLVVRPAGVFLSGIGTSLDVREKLMLALTAPRGVVAASFAFLLSDILAREERGGGEVLVPLVFIVISVTVLFSGLLGRPLARLLGVFEGERPGLLLVGANALGRLVGNALQRRGVPVHLVDKSRREVARARADGLRASAGDATDAAVLEALDLDDVGKVLALTPNQEVNILACAAAARLVGDDEVFRLDDRQEPVPADTQDVESWGRPLAEVTASPAELSRAAADGRLEARWGASAGPGAAAGPAAGWPLLARVDGRVVFPEEPRWRRDGSDPEVEVLYLVPGDGGA